jgi:hypothetical protein
VRAIHEAATGYSAGDLSRIAGQARLERRQHEGSPRKKHSQQAGTRSTPIRAGWPINWAK